MRHFTTTSSRSRTNPWLRAGVVAVVLAFALYSAWQQRPLAPEPPGEPPGDPRVPIIIENPFVKGAADSVPSAPIHPEGDPQLEVSTPAADRSATRTTIPKQTIRDQDGRVIFRGDVDVGPTLARIKKGGRIGFSHDGIVFQNRERRLPRQPPGYYHEFVHPTPGLGGPGPQRIVMGREGETYYTPDHYRSFRRLDE